MPFGDTASTGITEGPDGIRRFDDPALQSEITAAFAAIPAGHRFAVIPHLTLDGPRMTAVAKLGDTFSVALSARHDWGGWKGDWRERGAVEMSATWSPF